MKQLVKVTTTIPRTQAVKSVFFNKLKSAQRLKKTLKMRLPYDSVEKNDLHMDKQKIYGRL